MNALLSKYPEEIQKILAKYPPEYKRSAIMPLLHLSQREDGYVTPQSLSDIAEICEVSETEVATIVGFYTLYYDQPLGRYHIQICTDLPCALRGAEKFLNQHGNVEANDVEAREVAVVEEVVNVPCDM